MSLRLVEHRGYLEDTKRMAAFEAATRAVIGEGDSVLDLGAGTGILGLLACRAGARRVYVVDQGPILEIARRNYQANGYGDRAVFVRGHSARIDLPERADVIIADQLGPFVSDAGLFQSFADARTRLLKPDARMIPRKIEFHLAPIECVEVAQRISFWQHRPAGFELGAVAEWAANDVHYVRVKAGAALAEPKAASEVDLREPVPDLLTMKHSFEVSREGSFDGILGCFRAELAEGIWLTNSPFAADCMDRHQVVLPLSQPVRVACGDTIDMSVRVRPETDMMSWSVEVKAGNAVKARAAHSTVNAALFSLEDVRRTNPDRVPSLNTRGEARLLLLGRCREGHTQRDIEQEILSRYGSEFPTPGDAAAFVASALAKDTK